jgi:hypothetical protein
MPMLHVPFRSTRYITLKMKSRIEANSGPPSQNCTFALSRGILINNIKEKRYGRTNEFSSMSGKAFWNLKGKLVLQYHSTAPYIAVN